MTIPTNKRIYVAGHRGLVGSAIVRALNDRGYRNIVKRTRQELDLTDQRAVQEFFSNEQPEFVYLAAARVGGIHANNTYPAEFIRDNLLIQTNIVDQARAHGVERLLFLGSSCIYPKSAPQPMREDCLLSGGLEPTNEPYAIAKIAGIKICESYNRQYGTDYRSVMPTNLYGLGDNYHPEDSHVIPALIRRFHEAKVRCSEEVVIWGTGSPRREFLYVDDLADACLHVMGMDHSSWTELVKPMQSHINVGCGRDITIAELAGLIREVVGYNGRIVYDPTRPDGTSRKLLDASLLAGIGWVPQITLADGLKVAYSDFIARYVQNIKGMTDV